MFIRAVKSWVFQRGKVRLIDNCSTDASVNRSVYLGLELEMRGERPLYLL